MSEELISNPFRPGAVVSAERFIGRRDVLRSIFSKLSSGQSIALVGLPGAGKTAVLHNLLSLKTWVHWLGQAASQPVLIELDCMSLAADCSPVQFWRLVLTRLEESLIEDPTNGGLTIRYDEDFLKHGLPSFFEKDCQRHGLRIVLLLDEFDTLLAHKLLGKAEFLAQLRSLLNRSTTTGLSAVVATQRRISELDDATFSMQHGSPFFNHLQQVFLGVMTGEETQDLILQSLNSIEVQFHDDDVQFVVKMSGRIPKLICLLSSGLFDVLNEGYREDDLYAAVMDYLEEDLRSYFQNAWRRMRPHQQSALIIAAVESILLARRIDGGLTSASYQHIKKDISLLVRLGFIQQDRRSQRILIGPLCFVYFILFDVLFEMKALAPSFRELMRRVGLLSIAGSTLAESVERAFAAIPWALRGSIGDFTMWLMGQSDDGALAWADELKREPELALSDGPDASSPYSHGHESVPTTASLRRLLSATCTTDASFVAFTIDHFPETARRFGDGMDILTKQNLLLQMETAGRIWTAIGRFLPHEEMDNLLERIEIEWAELPTTT